MLKRILVPIVGFIAAISLATPAHADTAPADNFAIVSQANYVYDQGFFTLRLNAPNANGGVAYAYSLNSIVNGTQGQWVTVCIDGRSNGVGGFVTVSAAHWSTTFTYTGSNYAERCKAVWNTPGGTNEVDIYNGSNSGTTRYDYVKSVRITLGIK